MSDSILLSKGLMSASSHAAISQTDKKRNRWYDKINWNQ